MPHATSTDRTFVLPADGEELRFTVYADGQPDPAAVQVWGRVSGSEWSRPADSDSDAPYTLNSLRLNGRVYDGRLRTAMLDILDMQYQAAALSPRHKAIGDVLSVLAKIQPVDDGTRHDDPAPAPAPHPPLTMDTVHALSRLANATQRGTRVRWLTETDDVAQGTLRHIVQATSDAFPREDDDPRDCRVRITTDIGMDHYFPVAVVLARMAAGEFGILD